MDEVEQLRKRNQELEEEQELRQRVCRLVAAEMRTPLAPMKGFVRTLLDDENEEWYTHDDRREFYRIIEDNIDRLERLLCDFENSSFILITGSTSLEMNWQEVDVRQVIESVVEVQQQRTDKHQLVLDFEPEQIIVETDPEKFANIFHSLISSAMRFSPDGEEVRITARLEPPNEEYPCGALLMAVKDQGLGMRKEDQKKLGEKFGGMSKKNVQLSSGTGVFLIHTLVKAHHGVLWHDSEGVGMGTTVYVRIPVKPPKAEQQQV